MEKEKVYLLLTDTGTLFTRMIKLYTKKPYNHASIAFDDNFIEVYSFGRKKPRNPFRGGFVNEDVRNGLFINARCAIYSCSVTVEQKKKMKYFIQEIQNDQHLYRYNLLGLVNFIINKPINRKHAFFCSEFVARVLKEGDLIQPQKPLSLISPHDLQSLEHWELEYEGQLSDQVHNEVEEYIFSRSKILNAL